MIVGWLAVGAGVCVGAVIVWWLLIRTEGVYLGRGAVIWLYDLYAGRYDSIKQFEPYNEDYYLARPILQRLPHIAAPLVLDVATGTGRVPLALLDQVTFHGRVVGLDLSRKMLAQAADKLAPYGNRVALLHHPAERLPFPENTFDLVTCLEALEFLMDQRVVLREMTRVLRPGGLLVLTNRQGIDVRLMPGRTFEHDTFADMLRHEIGLAQVAVEVWQIDYRIVWARKAGYSDSAGPLPLAEIWQCPQCGAVDLVPVAGGWRCLSCEVLVPEGDDGVIEANRLLPDGAAGKNEPGRDVVTSARTDRG
ncbi:MAG: methyltransferase domain-containing protein [Anaerolineae bacterium]|nr:methyltransferase domain-containing protein [Anaerolineae bacterium]